jgi:hypothetical protein
MTARPAKRLLAHGWLYIPAVSSPVGGGLIKLGHGSTWAAVAVGMAPYAICAFLYAVFVIGYLAALIRYLCVKSGEQVAMERLITLSANAIVAILTLTAIRLPAQPPTAPHTGGDTLPTVVDVGNRPAPGPGTLRLARSGTARRTLRRRLAKPSPHGCTSAQRRRARYRCHTPPRG